VINASSFDVFLGNKNVDNESFKNKIENDFHENSIKLNSVSNEFRTPDFNAKQEHKYSRTRDKVNATFEMPDYGDIQKNKENILEKGENIRN
jgi:hypothetical protein